VNNDFDAGKFSGRCRASSKCSPGGAGINRQLAGEAEFIYFDGNLKLAL
jgi:hypothetical protein